MTIVVIRASIRISAVTSCIVCPYLHHVSGVVLRYNIFMFLHVWCRICGPSGPGHLGYIAYTHCCPGHGVVTLMLSGDQSFCWLTEDNPAVVILLSYPCILARLPVQCCGYRTTTLAFIVCKTPHPGYTRGGMSCDINTMVHCRAAGWGEGRSNVPHSPN